MTVEAFRLALKRGEPAAKTQGALLEPLPEGSGVSGGWRARNKVPSAKVVNRTAGAALLIGALAVGAHAIQQRRRIRAAQ